MADFYLIVQNNLDKILYIHHDEDVAKRALKIFQEQVQQFTSQIRLEAHKNQDMGVYFIDYSKSGQECCDEYCKKSEVHECEYHDWC